MAGRPPLDLNQKIRELLEHTCPVELGVDSPILNFDIRVASALNLIRYVDAHIQRQPHYQSVYDRHKTLLHLQMLGSLIEAFERFLKEVAIVCVDFVAPNVFDDRFEKIPVRAGDLARQFDSGSVGRAMCESDTWLSNKDINERFRKFLKVHFGDPWERLFPIGNETPTAERERAMTLSILWQIRHNITHNSGYLTDADAKKITLLAKTSIEGGNELCPTLHDLRYVKEFLVETARHTNNRIATRLAELLTELHAEDGSLFVAQEMANQISQKFQQPVVVGGATGFM